ncbi:urea transporter [Pseudomonas sp. GD03944]|uniref:urea transporter n=1 Tax=Pseudomonas sp. GD03944 TaxID=2975409 RepID=UPI00244746CF|nr:urea transporter [Pseudomonas sp. GD03944]MDH1262689.1 urea transporter [Pseudomonas sp. GD03944]
MRHALRCLRALLNGFSQIFLQTHAGCGALVVLAILIGAPQLLGGALLGGLSSMLAAHRRGYPAADIACGLYGYNGILLGLLISLQFAWSPCMALLIVASAGLSSLALGHWMARLRQRQWLPAFTFPFVALGWVLMGLAPALPLEMSTVSSALTVTPLDGLGILLALLRGIGQVIFLDTPLAGACLWLGLLLADRRAAGWALLGSTGGTALALCLGWPTEAALAGLYGYNACLAAIALSQVHRSPWAPALGIGLALLLQPGFTALGLAALTMPFILACWLVQASIRTWQRAVADGAPPLPRRPS